MTILRNPEGICVDDALRAEFPAVFNDRPSPRLSDGYQLYRSYELIDLFQAAGMKLVEINQQASRVRDPRTQLHTLRFRTIDAPAMFGVNDSVPEIVLLNGHDGRNKFRALAGIFRFICSNGLVISDMDLGTVTRRHFGANNTFDKVREIVADLPEAVNKMSRKIFEWEALTLDFDAQAQLASACMKARVTPDWVLPEIALEARRVADDQKEGVRSLWTTFNVLQENLTNVELQRTDNSHRSSLRPLTGAFRSLTANQALWTTAQAYYDARVEEMSETEREALSKARKAATERARYAASKGLLVSAE